MVKRFCGLLLVSFLFLCGHTDAHEKEEIGMMPAETEMGTDTYPMCEAEALPVDVRLDKTDRLIMEIAETYGVPPGALYGIWQKETHGLKSGWGSASYWYQAPRLTWKESVCVEQYGVEKCWDQWLSLKRLCAQRRHGMPVSEQLCNPLHVYTSYAMALGPMQHMPASLLPKRDDGTYTWASHATDYDKDGVVDPFSLPDAMASTAKFLRYHYRRRLHRLGPKQAWRYAINRYYGSQHAGYYEGDGRRPGVLHHWRQWCKATDTCKDNAQESPALALRPPLPK